MDELETYTLTELPANEALLQELDDSVTESLKLFATPEVFDPDRAWELGLWEVPPPVDPGAAPTNGLSQSTTSMIITSVNTALALRVEHASSSYRWRSDLPPILLTEATRSQLDRHIRAATKLLQKSWADTPSGTKSNSFGTNDVLTLSWHYDIFAPSDPKITAEILDIVAKRAQRFKDEPSILLAIRSVLRDEGQKDGSFTTASSYVLLRFARLLHHLRNAFDKKHTATIEAALERMVLWLQPRLHEQLSHFEISDSNFDPAELAFSLEGLLLLRPDVVDQSTVERALQVMARSQEAAPSWRTSTPMVANHRGQVLFPVSLETAFSLLSSISIFDSRDASAGLYASLGSKYLPMFQRYWRWLRARRIRLKLSPDAQITGWSSEHFNDTKLIHTWQTSLVLGFILVFRDQLMRHVARQLLVLSRLTVRLPSSDTVKWTALTSKFEPTDELGPDYEVYKKIGGDFVESHLDPESPPPFWSMMLYGPPGTGKSTMAENLAASLKVPLITVTVADFLAGGQAQMENRAKLVFRVLESQPLSVVLFDEIDQFLLDRDSKRYRELETPFQFLTPGMLTKLGKLRDAKRVIFIVATNYAERIDPAIKRTGRIDRRYLLLPLGATRRTAVLTLFPSTKAVLVGISPTEQARLTAASVFLSFTDLKTIARTFNGSLIDLVDALARAARSIRFSAYGDRFAENANATDSELHEEFVAVCRMANDLFLVGPDTAQEAFKAQAGPILAEHASLVKELARHGVTLGGLIAPLPIP